MRTEPDQLARSVQASRSEREPSTPLAAFGSSWTLLVLCAVGAVIGAAIDAVWPSDGSSAGSAGVAAGLGAVGGIVVHYLGRGLLWASLGWAALRAVRLSRHDGRS